MRTFAELLRVALLPRPGRARARVRGGLRVGGHGVPRRPPDVQGALQLFKSKDHYDYFSRALQHDDLCADHSGADCDKYEPDLEQALWYDMEFSLNKEIL